MSSTATKPSVVQFSVAGQQTHADSLFPLAYERRDPAVDLESSCAWVRAHTGQLQEEACRHGAVFLRGFGLRTAEDFDRFITAFGLPPFTYEDSLSYAVRVNRTPKVF